MQGEETMRTQRPLAVLSVMAAPALADPSPDTAWP